MLDKLTFGAKAVLAYLGDAAHRRFISTIVALAATHFLGRVLDASSVANLLEILIGGFGGAWSSRTPALDALEPDDLR